MQAVVLHNIRWNSLDLMVGRLGCQFGRFTLVEFPVSKVEAHSATSTRAEAGRHGVKCKGPKASKKKSRQITGNGKARVENKARRNGAKSKAKGKERQGERESKVRGLRKDKDRENAKRSNGMERKPEADTGATTRQRTRVKRRKEEGQTRLVRLITNSTSCARSIASSCQECVMKPRHTHQVLLSSLVDSPKPTECIDTARRLHVVMTEQFVREP